MNRARFLWPLAVFLLPVLAVSTVRWLHGHLADPLIVPPRDPGFDWTMSRHTSCMSHGYNTLWALGCRQNEEDPVKPCEQGAARVCDMLFPYVKKSMGCEPSEGDDCLELPTLGRCEVPYACSVYVLRGD